MMSARVFALIAVLGLQAACESEKDDSHDHGGGDHPHGEEAGDHGQDHGDGGHDEAAGGHDGGHAGHGGHGGGIIIITHYTEHTELFVEYPALAVNRESPFAAHFTRLDTWEPVTSGRLTVRLSGGGAPDETFDSGPSSTAGIFRPVVKPEHAATRKLTFELDTGEFTSVHEVGEYRIYPAAEEADAASPHEHRPEGLVPFSKEQQWKVEFATAPVQVKRLSASIAAPGVLSPAPGGEAWLVAPTDGLLLVNGGRIPEIGDKVEAGQIIARLSPHLGGEQDYATLVSERASAEAAWESARQDRKRVERLLAEGAVSQRRLEEAQAAERTAKARFDAAKARLGAVQGRANAGAGIAIRAPVSGRIAQIGAGRGQFVNQGTTLFRIVDTRILRLTAQIAEIDAVEMAAPTGTWFTPAGGSQVYEITAENGRVVAAGGAVDPVKRTVPVIFEFENPDGAFRAGMNVSAHIRTNKTFAGPAIPASAVVDDAGQPVVFVMSDAENWERRVIRVALRDGEWIGVSSGVTLGERVVSRGAWLVHLAASGPAEAGHGHVH
ncbi:MAG: efflux RND transporter periplasmic adaptor subunit [Alphaproteobacteria bacterium]